MTNTVFSSLTACGGCCTGCEKHLQGACPGCIAADGYVPEWAQSGRCRVHACARSHGAAFCGVCPAFPCEGIARMMPWNTDIIRHMEKLANEYNRLRKENCPCSSSSKAS